jgi:hypothetical protein
MALQFVAQLALHMDLRLYVVGCFAGSEIMVTNVQRYIFKNHFCFSIFNSRNKIPVGVGVAFCFALGVIVEWLISCIHS